MAAFPTQESTPECTVCAGTGWKTIAVPGKANRVTRCDCRIEVRGERLLRAARIPRRHEHCTLEDFATEFEGADPSLDAALIITKLYSEQYPLERAGLLFEGPFGTGKTHLAVGLVKALINKGTACLFYDYRELLKEVQNSYNPSISATELGILKPVFDAEVLVLDELGAAKPTEWVWDAVQFILNSRYNSRLTTVFTTNFPFLPCVKQKPDETIDHFKVRRAGHRYTLGDRIGDRMMSRIEEMCRIVHLDGKDFRKGPKSATKCSSF